MKCCSFSGHSQNKIGSPMNFVVACGTWLHPETQTIIYPSLSLDSIDISFPRFVGIVYQIKFSVFFITFSSFCSFLRQMHLPAMRFTEIEINEKWIRNYDNKNLFCIQDILYAQYFNTFKVTMFKIKIEIQIETE